MGVGGSEPLTKPVWILLRMIKQRERMITAARRGNKCRPTVVLLQHRTVVGPRTGVRERPLAVGDAGNTGADGRVVAVAADDLPGRAVQKSNEHLVVVGRLARRGRKRLVNPPLASVRVDRSPNRLAALQKFGQAVPI